MDTPAPGGPVSDGDVSKNATTSRLAALPEELLSNISIKLGSDDIFALRLTCRDIEAKTFHEFATEYFSGKCFILSTESLKVLLNIADHPKLREYLTKVYVAPAEFRKVKTHCEHGRPIRATVRQREALAYYIADQKQLQASGGDMRFLVEAFSKLPNVRQLAIVDHTGGLPDGVECRGLQKVYRTTGTHLPLTGISKELSHPGGFGHPPPQVNYAWVSHVWTTLLHAAAESGASTYTRLDADLALGLSPLTDLKFKKSKMPILANAFSNLEELSLQIRAKNFRTGRADGEEDGHRARTALKTFAMACPKVTALTLKFGLDPDPSPLTGSLFKAFMSKIDHGNLTKLSVDSLGIDMKTLASTVCKLKSVQTLSFYALDLVSGGGWIPILKAIAQLPALDHLHLMYLTEASCRVYFLEQPSRSDYEWPSADMFGQFGQVAGGEDQWTEEDTSDSDDELPQLIPDGVVPDEQVLAPAAPTKIPCTIGGENQYKAPGCQEHPERGYYVCIEGQDEIQREIPKFIKHYNTGETALPDDIGDVFFNTLLGVPAGAFPNGPAAAAGVAGPPAGGAGNAGGNPFANLQANLQANINGGGNPMANLQAMFGPPTQVGGNAQNGYATYAFPVQMGNGANPFANPFTTAAPTAAPTNAAPPPQQAPPAQQAPSQQAPPPPPQASQAQQTAHAPAPPGPAAHQWNLPSLSATTEGASEDSMMEDELD